MLYSVPVLFSCSVFLLYDIQCIKNMNLTHTIQIYCMPSVHVPLERPRMPLEAF